MENFMDFSSDRVNVFFMLIDSSGSMEDDASNVRKGLEMYKRSFQNFPESNSIAVSISKFDDSFYPADFRPITDLDISYHAGGATALHYSIVQGAKRLKEYMQEITAQKGIVPRGTFIIFSDGVPCNDPFTMKDGKRAIEELNLAGVTTVFVAFGEAITSNFGKELGCMSTIDVTNREKLVNFLGVELSKSCKEQSKSMKSLGANFFSQAAGNNKSEGYSQTTAQVLEDTAWIDDI